STSDYEEAVLDCSRSEQRQPVFFLIWSLDPCSWDCHYQASLVSKHSENFRESQVIAGSETDSYTLDVDGDWFRGTGNDFVGLFIRERVIEMDFVIGGDDLSAGSDEQCVLHFCVISGGERSSHNRDASSC